MSKPNAKTVADFRSAHDPNVIVPAKINAVLQAMLKEGPEQWEYEADLIKRANISQTQISQFRELFIDHIIETPHAAKRSPRRVWFADKKVAKRIREG